MCVSKGSGQDYVLQGTGAAAAESPQHGAWLAGGFWKGLLYPQVFSSNCGVVFCLSILLPPS